MSLLGNTKLIAPAVLATSIVAQTIPADTEDKKTLASGLAYSVLVPGEGDRTPKPHEMVRVHYTGWLTDGSVFDSSRNRGEPSVFPLKGVIAGWREGLQLMTEGARHKLTIPADLAYGERGRPGIPANSELIFDVELLAIQPTCDELDPEKTEKGASGASIQKLASGDGEVLGADMIPQYEFAWWDDEGTLQEGTWKNGRTLPPGILPRLPFMADLGETKIGDAWRIDAPPGCGYAPEQVARTERWMIRLTGITKPLPVPEFELPKVDECEVTESGLMYRVLEAGDENGNHPAMGDKVRVHYAGWLENGRLFDNSYERGEPSEFALGRVIAGWNEGLALMRPGAKYLFRIPADLAYGKRGSPPSIPPDSPLVFLVELLSFEAK